MKYIAAILAATVLTGMEVKAQPQLADAIRVVVHNAIVTRLQVEDAIGPLGNDLIRQYGSEPATLEKKLNELRDENTDMLVEHELILHEFETGGYHLPESIIDEFVQQNIRRRYGDRATLTRSLQDDGITYEKFRQRIRDQFIIEQMRFKNISDIVVISPHKIEVYYVTHTNDFKVEEQLRLRMIVLNKGADDAGQARKLAEEIRTKANEGSAFADLARLYSQGLHASEGGDWGWVTKSVLRKELDEAAFRLKPGERSDVIETPEACYVIQVDERNAEHIRPLGEVRDEIEKRLLAQEQDRLKKQWVERLKKKTFVRYFE